MPALSDLLLAIFDGEKGAVFAVLLIALLIAGAIVLVVNLSTRDRPARPPAWEPVPDDEPMAPASLPDPHAAGAPRTTTQRKPAATRATRQRRT